MSHTTTILTPPEGSGRRTGVTETWVTGPARRIDYTFDELHRLTDEHETRGAATRHVQYEYDDVGNRVRRTLTIAGGPGDDEDVTYSYDANDRLLSANGTTSSTTYDWDANGNLTFKNAVEYNWDDQDRLTDAEGWVFEYDADGLKQSSDPPNDGDPANGDPTRHVVDTTFPYAQVLEDRGPVGITNYLRGLQPIRLTRGGQSWWYLHDALGSTRALVAAGGTPTVTDEWDYEAFGEVTRRVGTTENRWLFAGEERREEIDLDYLRARWMDPTVGRFASRDPLEGDVRDARSLDAFVYALDDPAQAVDRSGLFAEMNLAGAVAAFEADAQLEEARSAQATVGVNRALPAAQVLRTQVRLGRAVIAGILLLADAAEVEHASKTKRHRAAGVHAGNIHVQGTDLHEQWGSNKPTLLQVHWDQPVPFTAVEGNMALLFLMEQLKSEERKHRREAFDKAARWIDQRRLSGGVGRGSWQFKDSAVRGSVARIDIEVYEGRAFIFP